MSISTVSSGDLITADTMNSVINFANSNISMSTIENVASEKYPNVFYQNRTGLVKIITFVAYSTTADTIQVKYYPYENPTYAWLLGKKTTAAGEYFNITIVVPPTHWFGFYCDISKTSMTTWAEATISRTA